MVMTYGTKRVLNDVNHWWQCQCWWWHDVALMVDIVQWNEGRDTRP